MEKVESALESTEEGNEAVDRRLSGSTQLVAGLEPLQISGTSDDSMGVIPETYTRPASPCSGNIKPPESLTKLCDGALTTGQRMTPPPTVVRTVFGFYLFPLMHNSILLCLL